MKTTPAMRPPALSPSECHAALAAAVRPALAYDGGDLETWRRRLRADLRRRVAGWWPRERISLNARTLWRRPHELGTIEKVVFAGEPHADIVAYVCLPAGVPPPYRFMICLQGHSTGMHNSIAVARDDETQPIDVAGDRDFGLGCMRRGVAALCIEQRSFGLRREQRQAQVCAHNGCHDAAMHALMLGRTLLGERVFDVDRGIDYLVSRGDADPRRIGVMGNSGGGTTSIFAAALLPRLSCAMPSCAFCTFRDCFMSIYHCGCNYVPGLYPRADMPDILGLFAPRPVVVVAGRDDDIFPLRGVRQAFRRLRAIYAAAGAADACRLVVGQGDHRFYAEDAWPVLLRVTAS